MRPGRRVQDLNETFLSGPRNEGSPANVGKKLTQLALDIRIKERLIEKLPIEIRENVKEGQPRLLNGPRHGHLPARQDLLLDALGLQDGS
jgi:hypothetical protein